MTLSIIDRAASYVHRNPSAAQKESGNYRKGHVNFQGLNITIENARGSLRRGVGHDGKEWSVKMPAHYGYIKNTEGSDGDHIDIYIGPHHKSPHVFVIDQVDADSKEYDEHKVMLGFGSRKQAENFYRQGFSDGRGKDRIGHVSEMDMDEFKDWIKHEDTTRPVGKFARGGVVKKMAENEKRNRRRHSWGDRARGPWDRAARKADGGPVTDPAILAQLNAPASDNSRVTDPAILAQLNGTAAPAAEGSGIASYIPKAISDIPHEAYEATAKQIKNIGAAWDAIRARHAEQAKKDAGPSGSFFDPAALTNQVRDMGDTGKALLSAASVPVAPIQGAAESLIGHPMADAEHAVGTLINPKVAAQDNPEAMYQTAKGDVGLAMSAAGARKAMPVSATPAPLKNVPAPSTKELFKAADGNYSNMRGLGVEIHPQAVTKVADDILTELHTEGYRDYLAPKTFRAVEELKNPAGQNVEIADIEGVRRALNKAAKDPGERDAVRRAISGIDDYLANLHPNDVVVNPHFAQRVGQEAAEARANYAAAKRSEQLDEINKKASRQANAAGSGTNIDNATRQRIKSILDDPKKLRGFSDAEKEQMENIVAGTKVGNIARLLGKFSPSGVVSGALSAGAGFAAHGPLGAVALPAAGYVAKKIGDASTAAQAARLSQLVRARSPLGKQAAINHVAQSVFTQPTRPTALAAPISNMANISSPYSAFRGLQGPVPSYADDKHN